MQSKIKQWFCFSFNPRFVNENLTISFTCLADAASQQGCFAKVYNRTRNRPYIKRCSATGGRHCHVDICFDFFVPCPGGVSSFTCVFDWLAISYGSLFLMFPRTIFPWVFLCSRCTTRARSSGVWPTHLLDEPGGFWNTCHQNACVGGRLQKKSSTHTKVAIKRNAVVNADLECLDGV